MQFLTNRTNMRFIKATEKELLSMNPDWVDDWENLKKEKIIEIL